MITAPQLHKIYLINRPDRTDRLRDSLDEYKQKIGLDVENVTIVPAVINEQSGAKGLLTTMKLIFSLYILYKIELPILVLEDDFKVVTNAFLDRLKIAIGDLKKFPNWDMLHLGPNTHEPLEKVSDHLLRMKHCRSTHAIIYSSKGVDKIFHKLMHYGNIEHIDLFYENVIQPMGECYCSYPLMVTQKSDFSNITNSYSDQSYIERRFLENTNHLK